MDRFICFTVPAALAGKERGQKKRLKGGLVQVIRLPDADEKFSVKETLELDNGDVILYLYGRPTRPKYPSRAELRRQAIGED